MQVIPYTSEHYEALCSILRKRDHSIPSEVPALGFIAVSDTLVSFCFLRMVEGNYAIVDGLASNPECSSALRHEGNDLVIKACIDEAKRLKLRNLIAFTTENTALERSLRNGFVKLQHSVIAYDLNTKG